MRQVLYGNKHEIDEHRSQGESEVNDIVMAQKYRVQQYILA
jgi:hypothetical protein